jgi:hypothetical protein
LNNEDNGKLVIFAQVKCQNGKCGYIETKQYTPPGIPYNEYVYDSINFRCSKCKSTCKETPSFSVTPNFFDGGDGNGSGQDKNKFSYKKSESKSAQGNDDDENESQRKKPSKSKMVVSYIKEQQYTTLFMDDYNAPHVALGTNNHTEVLKLNSSRFKNWLRGVAYNEMGIVVDSSTLSDMIGLLTAEAEFNPQSKAIKLGLRTANYEGDWYYDLTNKDWEFIRITSEGWYVVRNSIIFRRFSSQLPQVYPSQSHEYPSDIFDQFMRLILDINVDEKNKGDYWLLVKCYLVYLFIPDVMRPILMPHGRQGGLKSSILEKIKMIVDPSVTKTLSFPHDKNELIQQLSHNHCAFYDNISKLPDWISDEFCRAVTGSGSSKRILYTDDEDFIYNFKRCIAFNGVNLAATKADLLDRGLILLLKRIKDEDWITPEKIDKQFEEIRPKLLAYIFDILVKVMAWKKANGSPKIKLTRMTQFSEYGEIIARCMGYPDGEFIRAYEANIKTQIEEIIETDQIAGVLVQWFNESWATPEWSGTASELLNMLEEFAETLKIKTNSKYWPKSPSSLSRRLNEVATPLNDIGIDIEFVRSQRGKCRTIVIRKMPSSSSSSSSDLKQAQISSKNEDDILSYSQMPSSMPSSEITENRAQKEDDDGDDGDDDILQPFKVTQTQASQTETNAQDARALKNLMDSKPEPRPELNP